MATLNVESVVQRVSWSGLMQRQDAGLRAVAAAAGVSVATVSRVLNARPGAARVSERTAAHVREAARRLGYVPNYHWQSAWRGVADTVALAVEAYAAPGGGVRGGLGAVGYWARILGGCEAATTEAGLALAVLGPSEERTAVEAAARGIRQRRYDGAVIPVGWGAPDMVRPIEEVPGAAAVLIQGRAGSALPTVAFDVGRGIELIVAHLAELGHRKLLWVGPLKGEGGGWREQEFMRAVWDAGLEGESVRWDAAALGGERHEAVRGGAREAMARRLGAGEIPTAVACYSDLAAAGVIQALDAAGRRVPEDVSVVGFDDVEAPILSPPLATVDHRFGELGYRATELLIEMVRGGEKARAARRGYREVLAPRLVVRESTGPARRG
jgi:LacI family transcriptional regulator